MEVALGQLIVDTPISANWVMVILFGIAIYFQKRANDKADEREKKIDKILEQQQAQITEHEVKLALHEEKFNNL